MKKLLPAAAAALALTSVTPMAFAATQIGEYLSLSGFGTLGAVQTNSDEGKLGRDRQFGGADKQASFDVDSNLGLQMTGTATSWLSATVQVLAAKRDKNYLEADIEWAFVMVKPIDGLSFRAGRVAVPAFAISDSRNIGYANNWVRAPNEVYGLNIFRNLDGLDVTYRKSLGSVAISATGFAGKSKFNALPGVDSDSTGKNMKGLNLMLETEWATFRAGRLTAKVEIPVLGVTGDTYTFTGFGVTVDRDNIVAQAEYVKRKSEQAFDSVDAHSWYVMGGYRFGPVLPYVILSGTKPEHPNTPVLVSALQKTTALGVRWDAFSAAAIKFQVERIDTSNAQGISFTTHSTPPAFPGMPPGTAPITKPVTAVSIALDFTF